MSLRIVVRFILKTIEMIMALQYILHLRYMITHYIITEIKKFQDNMFDVLDNFFIKFAEWLTITFYKY